METFNTAMRGPPGRLASSESSLDSVTSRLDEFLPPDEPWRSVRPRMLFSRDHDVCNERDCDISINNPCPSVLLVNRLASMCISGY